MAGAAPCPCRLPFLPLGSLVLEKSRLRSYFAFERARPCGIRPPPPARRSSRRGRRAGHRGCEIASGSEQRPKASSPPSEITEIRRAWRSAGSANEQNCSTAWPRITARCLRPGDVRDRERELARAGGQPGHSLVEGAEAAERVKEGVERVGIVIELPLPRLRVDQPQALGGVILRDRQVDVHERVAVAELALLLLAGVQADRALDAQVLGDPADLGQPAAKGPGDHGQDDVVDGGALRSGVLDPLQPLEGEAGPGDLPARADVLVELGVAPRPELPPEGGRAAGPGCAPPRLRLRDCTERGRRRCPAGVGSATADAGSRRPRPRAARRRA